MTRCHVIPVNDLREHQDNDQCWCRPKELEDEPSVLVHNSMDQRELFESGQRKPS